MACLDEFTCSVYADGELPEGEASEVAKHLQTCRKCREIVDALRVESRALMECLQEVDAFEHVPASIIQSSSLSVARFGILTFGTAALVKAALGFLGGVELPASLEWLDPTRTAGQLNLVANAISYVLLQGGSIMESILNSTALIALNLLGLFIITMLLRRSIGTTAILSVIALIAVFSTSSYALDIRTANERPVTVPEGETVNDTLVVFAESVNINGTVNGDLIAIARDITIRGTVKGNVISFGQHVTTEGTVEGSIFGVGQNVLTRGQVTRNVYGFGQDVSTGNGARVTGNALLLAAEANVDGMIGHDLWAFCNRTNVRGNISRNVAAYANDVIISAPAVIGGDLTAHVRDNKSVRVETGAMIGGKTDIQVRPPEPSRYVTVSFYIRQILWLAASLIFGLVAFWLSPALTRVNLDSARTLLVAAGIGFLGIVATPITAIIIACTIIGLPIGLVTLALWGVGLYLAKIVLAGFLGRSLLAAQGEQQTPPALMLLLGLVLVLVAINLPYVGALINILLTLFGFGALLLTLYQSRRPALA